MKQLFMALLILLISAPALAQWLDLQTPGIPRLADGTPDLSAPAPRDHAGNPDLSGLWSFVGMSGDLPESDKFQDWMREQMAQRASRFFADEPRFNCLPSGPAYLTVNLTLGIKRIIQSPSVTVILHSDMVHRQVFTDGRELEEDPLPAWLGYSVGRWEGEVFVVESNGYNAKTWLDRRGAGHTEQLRITERYRRPDFGHLELRVTYEDPGAFTAPLEALIQLEHLAEYEMLESVCNEAERLGSDWGGDLSQAEARAVELEPEILAGYEGVFEGYWLGNPIKLEFRLEEGELKLRRNGIDVRLIPQSETTFDGSNGYAFLFTVDDEGIATSVEEMHVSRGWHFPRVP